MEKLTPIAVLGAGSWGTALAILLAKNGQKVHLWGHDPKHISDLYHQRSNKKYLPNVVFPDNLEVHSDLKSALTDVQDILIAVPSHAFRELIQNIKNICSKDCRFILGTKGLDPQTDQLLSTVVEEILGKHPIAVIAGPSFAKEVALGLPTAITLGYNNFEFAQTLVQRFHNATFRVYTTDDFAGVQICGAVKNVIALAVGASDGLGLGANARSALLTRGLAEMTRLGIAMGGKQETFMGLAGMGDLVLTATDSQSRNRRFGLALGHGKNLKEVQAEINQVVEGVNNAARVHALAKKLKIEMPITEQVYKVLHENSPIADVVKNLLARDPKEERV